MYYLGPSMKCIYRKFVRIIAMEQVLKAFNINLTFPEFSLGEVRQATNLPKQTNVCKWNSNRVWNLHALPRSWPV